MLSATRSRWGQRLGQKKAAPKNGTYEKQKPSKSDDFEDFWYAVRDSNCGVSVFSNFFRIILCQTV